MSDVETAPRTSGGPSDAVGLAPGQDRPRRGSLRAGTNALSGMLAKYGLLFAFAVIIIVFSLIDFDTFLSVRNLRSILELAAPSLVVAAGLTVLLTMHEFDVSIGSMIGLSSATAIALQAYGNVHFVVAIIVALLIGVIAGALSGYFVAYLGGGSLIITLAMTTVLIGAEFLITNQETIFQGIEPGYLAIGQASFLGINIKIFIAAAVALIVWLLLDKSELGRYMYAIGGNREAARLAGVPTTRILVLAFIITAVCAAIGGILLSSVAGASSPDMGAAYMLPAFAAVFLGSAVFRPGTVNLPGTVVGVLFLGVVQTGLLIAGLQAAAINIIEGAILIAGVLLGQLGRRR